MRWVIVLGSVVVVLLAANLIRAEAGGEPPDDPYIVKLLPRNPESYYRVWSDGRIDDMERDNNRCDFIAIESFGPVEHPFPVVDAVPAHGLSAVMMTFEDGRVDLVGPTGGVQRCTIVGIGTPSFCTADTDRDCDVDVADLLTLLAQWGPCE